MDRKHFILAVFAIASTPFSVAAFDVYFGFSGCSEYVQQRLGLDSPWFGATFHIPADQPIRRTSDGFIYIYDRDGFPCFRTQVGTDIGASDKLRLGFRAIKSNNDVGSILGAVVDRDRSAPGVFTGAPDAFSVNAVSNAVFTSEGWPYSWVFNFTSTNMIVNNVAIPQGSGRLLYMPLLLEGFPPYVGGTTPYCLTDLDGNGIDAVLHGSPYRSYTEVFWSGDIVLRENGYNPSTNDYLSTERLLYADMQSSNYGRPMYGRDGRLVRASITNVVLATWWDFDESLWSKTNSASMTLPKALINGSVVCGNHTTGHIVAYNVSTNKINVLGGDFTADFDMSQLPAAGMPGGPCVMRCWGAAYGTTTNDYARAPASHKAELSAGTRTAKFRFTYDAGTDEWSLEALGVE